MNVEELDDEALERKVMADLANFSCGEDDGDDDDDEYGLNKNGLDSDEANFHKGSIFFDDYMKRQNERLQHDKEENEKENKLYKEFLLKNNTGGQEIFDEIDKDLANLKKMTKVKVKWDNPQLQPHPQPGSEDKQEQRQRRDSITSSISSESFVEIEDAFGEKERYRPDVITESQYYEIKAKAKLEAAHNAKQIVFAEDAIRQQFIKEQGLLSEDESVVFSEGEQEDLEDVPLATASDSIPSKERTLMKQSSLVSSRFKRNPLKNNASNVSLTTPSKMQLLLPRTAVAQQSSLMLSKSQARYEEVMSGRKELRSSINASIVFKQQLEAKLEARQDRTTYERELIDMDNEDFLSSEYEDFIHKKAFAMKDFRLPIDGFILPKESLAANEPLFYQTHTKPLVFDIPLLPNQEGNVLTRNSLEICLQDLSERQKKMKKLWTFTKPASTSTTTSCLMTRVDMREGATSCLESIRETFSIPCISPGEIFMSRLSEQQEELLSRIEQSKTFEAISSIAASYKPRLIQGFFDANSENIVDAELLENASVNGNAGRSLSAVISVDVFNTFSKKRKLEMKLESLRDVEGIDRLPMLEVLTLTMNQISDISAFTSLSSCSSRIVELNLSQNRITDYSCVRNLTELRSLNLELNLISQMADLSPCKHLEMLNLNTNKIKKIEGLNGNQQLRRLTMFRNNLCGDLSALKQAKLLFLEEIDVSRNGLNSLEGVQSCVLLRKLVASHNKITEIPRNFAFIFLSETWLNNNLIESIDNLSYLPCLSYLNISGNRIATIKRLPLLPNLSTLIVSFNAINNFESVFTLLRVSPNLKVVNFSENAFLTQRISDDLRDLYDYLLIRYLPRLEEINLAPFSSGRKKYLQFRFNSLLKRKEQLKEEGIQMFLSEFALLSRQHTFIAAQKKHRKENIFAQTLSFQEIDAKFTLLKLKEMLLSRRRRQSNITSTLGVDGIFFRKDAFSNRYLRAIHKIKSLAYRVLYRIRKRARMYTDNLRRIIQIQAAFKGYTIRKVVNFQAIFANRKRTSAAIQIQSLFRGYRLRAKKRALFKGIKYEDDEELPELDDDWLKQQPEDYDTGLIMPSEFNVFNFLQQPAAEQQKKPPTAPTHTRQKANITIPPTTQRSHNNVILTHNGALASGDFNCSDADDFAMQNSMTTPSQGLQRKNLLSPINSSLKNLPKGTETGGVRLPSISGTQAQSNNFMRGQQRTSNSRTGATAAVLTGASAGKNSVSESLSSSGLSFQSQNSRKSGVSVAISMNSADYGAGARLSNTRKTAASTTLAPVKPSFKVSEEEKQKIMDDWGFTKPEVVQTFAYRLEKARRNKVKSLPLTSEQRYDKFLLSSKQKK